VSQIILRNSANPESAIATSLKFIWARKKASRNITSLLPFISLAVGCLVVFAVAGGLSSRISTAVGDEVLVAASHCAMISDLGDPATVQRMSAWKNQQVTKAINYAQQCYAEDEFNTMDCNKFITSRLPSAEVDQNADCPFDDRICRTTSSNLRLDTGSIDSSGHIGLNTPSNERLSWRYVLHCAPLQTNGYTSTVARDNIDWVRYHYGTWHTNADYIYEVEDIQNRYNHWEGPSRGAVLGLQYVASIRFHNPSIYPVADML
jgi:hypothetical protein